MIGSRRECISPLRPHGRRSRRKPTVPACRDSVSCSRRSCADGVLRPLRRTKRTSKPHRRLPHRTVRKALSLSWRRRAFALQRASPPGRVRRRRRPRRARVRSAGTSRPPPARACASSPSRAPCGGGSRGSGRHMELPLLELRRIGRVGSPGPSLRRARTDCAPAREESFRTGDTCPARFARRCAGGGARAHKRVSSPGPCVALRLPPWDGWNRAAGAWPARRLAGGSPPGGDSLTG